MIVPMKRIRIGAPHALAVEIIQALGRMGLFHISDPEKDPAFMFEDMSAGFLSKEAAGALAEAESLILSIMTTLNSLPRVPSSPSPPSPGPAGSWLDARWRESIHNIADSVTAAAGRLEAARAELKEALTYREVFLEFSGLIEVVASSTDVDLVGVSFPREGQRAIAVMEAALDKATGGVYSIFRSKSGGDAATALVVIPVSLRSVVSEKVFARKIQPIHLPERYAKSTFASTLAALMERGRDLAQVIERTESELMSEAIQWRGFLESARQGLLREIAPLRAQERLIHSGRVFWITGWAPAKDAGRVAEELARQFGGSALVFIKEPEIKEWEHVPVGLANPGWARPFERIVDLYAPPVYGAVDPTIFVAITFPLFFGLIMGDVGHAALLALLGWGLSKTLAKSLAPDVARIVYSMAGSAAIFGLMFGEFFGGMWSGALPAPALFDRKEGAGVMLGMVLLIGFFHVALGAILGAVNAVAKKAWREGAEKVTDLVLLACLLWAGAGVEANSVSPWALWTLAGAFGVKVAVGWSLRSALEAPKLISNALSYARLMALGLASIALADLANDFIAGGMIGGVAAGVAFHVLNFVIGVVSPAIQSARLHYVEFFGQFFEPAGERYSPLVNSR